MALTLRSVTRTKRERTILALSKLAYRPEIDGLRAVAVLIILMFHLDVSQFSGGYVGVDVFFVISGYLITRLLREDVEAGDFTFARFFGRRIRRLFPALLVTIGLVLFAGFLMLTPGAYSRLGASALFATFSLANIKFWLTTSYFDEAAGLRPLLHMWSLSVEEQFYLVWPGLIWLLMRWGGGWRLPGCILALALASLAWAQWALGGDTSLAFFLAPARVCEFAIGALLVWVPSSSERSVGLRDMCLAIGLGAVAWSAVSFDAQTVFPGMRALVPCCGTALALWAGNTPRLGFVLSNSVSVQIGKISYSLYLVHWPLIVFYKQLKIEPLDWGDRCLLLLLSFGLAALLNRHVERRFRYRKEGQPGLPANRFVTGTALATLCVGTFSLFAVQSGGIPGRYPEAYRSLLREGDRVTAEDVATWGQGKCYFGGSFGNEHDFHEYDRESCLRLDPERPNVLVFGDSTAAHLMHGLQTIHGDELNLLQATVAKCRGAKAMASPGNCRDLHQYILRDWLPKHADQLDSVVVATRWEKRALLPWGGRLIERIQNRGVGVVVVGPPVTFNTATATFIGARHGPGRVHLQLAAGERDLPAFRLPIEGVVEAVFEMEEELREIAARLGAGYISLIDKQCVASGCMVAAAADDGHPTFIQRDKLHFTPNGSIWAASKISAEELLRPGS